MCTSSDWRWLIAAFVPVLLWTPPDAPGQMVSNIERVQRLVRAAFPELREPSMPVEVTVESRFDADWHQFGSVTLLVMPRGERPERPENQFLGGWFFFTNDVIEHAYFNGQHVSALVRYRLESEIEAHPDWSAREIAAAVSRAGAKYGSDKSADFVRELRIPRFEPALGTILKTQVQFPSKDEGDPHPSLAWIVTVETSADRGHRHCYSMWFEPIGGKLVSLWGKECE